MRAADGGKGAEEAEAAGEGERAARIEAEAGRVIAGLSEEVAGAVVSGW